MNRFLLPIMSLMFIATGANAQSATSMQATTLNDAKSVANITTLSHTNAAKAPRKSDSEESLSLLAYQGADFPIGTMGFPSVSDANMVASQLLDIGEKFQGYTITGMRFAVAGSLGTGASLFGVLWHGDESEEDLEAPLTTYDVTDINGMDTNWNDVNFNKPVEITKTDLDIRFGYFYTQDTDEDSPNARPILYGEPSVELNKYAFLMCGSLNAAHGYDLYSLYNYEKFNCVPSIMLIAKNPKGESAVIGIDGSVSPVAEEYFSLEGKKLATPQKGVNIVKMSDGTTRKMVVAK